MKKAWMLLIVALFFSCTDTAVDPVNCSTEATVVNLTGLDGCGFVFELEDGQRLEPIRMFYCGTPPLPKEVTEDPLYGFEFTNGKKVLINYHEVEGATACMVGHVVKITCITDLGVSENPEL